MTLLRLLSAAFAIALMFGATHSFADEADGRELYLRFQCWQCHGYEGQGGPGPRIAGKEYPFDAFSRFVRHPGLMPPYTPNLLGDEELRSIHDYVRSIPEPPALEDIPALSDD